MGNVICPISQEKVDRNVVRITGFFMASSIAVYLKTDNIVTMIAITADYGIRAFTSGTLSPFATLASKLSTGLLGLSPVMIGKAPKIFASRVGFCFAASSTVAYYTASSLDISKYIAGTLMGFALLESVANFCFGCVVYQYVVLPLFGPNQDETNNKSE